MKKGIRTCPHCVGLPESPNNPAAIDGAEKKKQRSSAEKKAFISRCNRVEGQVRGIRSMIEEDLYCDDILNQIAAARAALDALSRQLLEKHMKSCLVSGIRSGDDGIIDELLTTLSRMMK